MTRTGPHVTTRTLTFPDHVIVPQGTVVDVIAEADHGRDRTIRVSARGRVLMVRVPASVLEPVR